MPIAENVSTTRGVAIPTLIPRLFFSIMALADVVRTKGLRSALW